MENLKYIVRMYFQKVSAYNILSGNLSYHDFNKQDFDALALQELPHLSETESGEVYSCLKNTVDKQRRENELNVFRALKELVKEYLLVRENQPVCRYDRLLVWRELIRSIGEDLAVCAFLAYRTETYGYVWNDFEWGTVIGHDNMQLNRIMQRGISDNHFHLFGSAPTFKLIWIRLMNQLVNGKYAQGLREIDAKKRNTRNKYSAVYQEQSLEQMHFQAALIRVILFYYINGMKSGRSQAEECSKKIEEKREHIDRILVSEVMWKYCCRRVQNDIDSFRMVKKLRQDDDTWDYANLGYMARSINHEFEGERALMYQMLLGEINGTPIPGFMMNWFYAYLTIQVKLREEMVQVNETLGFANFSQYTSRKGKFLYTPQDEKKMIQHAVRGSFESQNLQSLEIRVTPKKTAVENSAWIRKCDAHIKTCHEDGEELVKRVYYVLHFPKKGDQMLEDREIQTVCRHGNYRDNLEQIAEELIGFRERYPEEAARVLGIDACAQEIGCRPEVFAPTFRKLCNHVVRYDWLPEAVKQWKITYHVGEDWMDAVDGLRAIDEAILFLNMKNGDRLGHATVLGINIRKWYQGKKSSICLPQQDYLDNIVWLYHKLIEYDIPDCETLKGQLLNQYDKYFKKLYPKDLSRDFLDYGINTYYNAWKLRGDNPVLYRSGRYENPYALFEPYWINDEIIGTSEIRLEKEAARLIYYYHYSRTVRKEGSAAKEVTVTDAYVDGVEKVQKAMQQDIARRGICIETNPSSNYLISTMKRYDEHPISNLFNLGLDGHLQENNDCAQIHVSINTDDKGVFHTSLENEYALMGCAMEQIRDDHGHYKYPKQMVYDWLNRIREHGNQQRF